MRAYQVAAFLALALLWPVAARGMDIDLVEVPQVTFDDTPFRVAIELVNPQEDIKAVTLGADPALKVRGPFSRGRSVRVVNGERTVSFSIHWEVTPTKSGQYSLGPVTVVSRSGKTRRKPLGTLRVVRRAQKGTAKLLVESLAGGPVGYPFRVDYTLLTSEERFEGRGAFGDARYPFGLDGMELALFDSEFSWTPLAADPDRSATPLRIGEDRNLLVQESIFEHEGYGYYATRFALLVTPRAPGAVDLAAKARLMVVGGTKRVRGLFGGVQEVPDGVQRALSSAPTSYAVEELPPNAPAGFTGAVGTYRIITSCGVQEANAFDPIVVTIRIEGEGLLEDVALPAWQDDEAISAEFQVATDVDPGKISGSAKVFTKTFRARAATVKALPPLPFPYFDPKTRRYAIALSQPVPLTIREVKTVTSADAVGGAGPAKATAVSLTSQDIVTRHGIGANYLSLGDERPRFEGSNRFGPLLWAVSLLPPFLWLALLVAPWLATRLQGGASPLAQALASVEGGTLDAVQTGLHRYARRRLELRGEVTAAELEQALRARVVPPEVVEKAIGLWRRLEAARFSGSGAVPSDVADVLRELDPCL